MAKYKFQITVTHTSTEEVWVEAKTKEAAEARLDEIWNDDSESLYQHVTKYDDMASDITYQGEINDESAKYYTNAEDFANN